MQNRLVLYPHVVVKNWEGRLSCGGPCRSKGPQPHTGLSSPGFQCPQLLAAKASRDGNSVTQRAAGAPGVLLKGPCMNLPLMDSL